MKRHYICRHLYETLIGTDWKSWYFCWNNWLKEVNTYYFYLLKYKKISWNNIFVCLVMFFIQINFSNNFCKLSDWCRMFCFICGFDYAVDSKKHSNLLIQWKILWKQFIFSMRPEISCALHATYLYNPIRKY